MTRQRLRGLRARRSRHQRRRPRHRARSRWTSAAAVRLLGHGQGAGPRCSAWACCSSSSSSARTRWRDPAAPSGGRPPRAHPRRGSRAARRLPRQRCPAAPPRRADPRRHRGARASGSTSWSASGPRSSSASSTPPRWPWSPSLRRREPGHDDLDPGASPVPLRLRAWSILVLLVTVGLTRPPWPSRAALRAWTGSARVDPIADRAVSFAQGVDRGRSPRRLLAVAALSCLCWGIDATGVLARGAGHRRPDQRARGGARRRRDGAGDRDPLGARLRRHVRARRDEHRSGPRRPRPEALAVAILAHVLTIVPLALGRRARVGDLGCTLAATGRRAAVAGGHRTHVVDTDGYGRAPMSVMIQDSGRMDTRVTTPRPKVAPLRHRGRRWRRPRRPAVLAEARRGGLPRRHLRHRRAHGRVHPRGPDAVPGDGRRGAAAADAAHGSPRGIDGPQHHARRAHRGGGHRHAHRRVLEPVDDDLRPGGRPAGATPGRRCAGRPPQHRLPGDDRARAAGARRPRLPGGRRVLPGAHRRGQGARGACRSAPDRGCGRRRGTRPRGGALPSAGRDHRARDDQPRRSSRSCSRTRGDT